MSSFSEVFYLFRSKPSDFPSKMVHVGIAWICHFLVLDSHLKAMGPIYGSCPLGLLHLFYRTKDLGPSPKVTLDNLCVKEGCLLGSGQGLSNSGQKCTKMSLFIPELLGMCHAFVKAISQNWWIWWSEFFSSVISRELTATQIISTPSL